MLPAERQAKIITLLEAGGAVTVHELSALLAVSEMTIHRDLQQLAQLGKLRKVRGGAVLVQEPDVAAEAASAADAHCPTCYHMGSVHTQVILHLRDGRHQRACCPHCGLMHIYNMGSQIQAALVTDFISGQVISAQSATYVTHPDITICCTPSVVAFRRPADAQRFQKGFGGIIMTMPEATAYIFKAMDPNQATVPEE
ncbi:MAG: DeoR/GlpR family DNA-binding transcription regulator [Candidatus Promineifilaceae bacterium]